eukprot:gnl/MRDRNA2_/MRDRNA2_61620_c0_seq1.p1 gnl/MRDRNA2_/MRDRNA2_61620_c0~~gnl/MRDRNA2_/MRDRNA2_61620_c0_seq1.p1  ORF type:complete len:1770 (+),score=338.45 gnl/MRDRNA2_/MRDRNA2_61620_c0_seq1:296-5311(+)
MSPAGDRLRIRCRQFPSLINCCTLDYFTAWPEDALLAVATTHLDEVSDLTSQSGVVGKLAANTVGVHMSALKSAAKYLEDKKRHVYITPKSYLDLIQLYISLYHQKRSELGKMRDRLSSGLSKLQESHTLVQDLQQQLTALRPQLETKSDKTEQLLVKVARDKDKAEEMRTVVQAEKDIVDQRSQKISALAEDAKADLERVMPEYRKAMQSVEKLEKKDIQEIKSFQNPPPLVLMVMECICTVLGQKTDWATAKNLLADMNFLRKLKDYDKDSIPDRTLQRLKNFVRREDFDPVQVEKQSHAAKSLCMWCRALNVYSDVAKEVEPKKARLQAAQAELAEAHHKLHIKQNELNEVLSKVNALEVLCHETMEEMRRLSNEKELTERRLERAQELTGALKDEESRWAHQISELSVQIQCLLGNVFMAASCIAYFGPFTQSYRADLVKTWLEQCEGCDILAQTAEGSWSLSSVMVPPVAVNEWRLQGLPADEVSTDSAILAVNSRRWPLCIDPQGQASRWLKNYCGENLKIAKPTNPKLARILESCISVGNAVLLQDLTERLPPLLDPVLTPNSTSEGRRTVRMGPAELDVDEKFKLYLTTAMANPHFLPQVFITVTIIDFTVSFEGLVQQLLSDVVKLENPEVEKRKDELIRQMSQDQRELNLLADRILSLLSESEGNILDQQDLIVTLSSSKETSEKISTRMEEQKITEAQLDKERSAFHSIAQRGALLYFVVGSMAMVDPMYVCSLQYVTQLFGQAIQKYQQSSSSDPFKKSTEATLENAEINANSDENAEGAAGAEGEHSALADYLSAMTDFITYHIFLNFSHGLFEHHKLMFAFHLCVEIGRQKGEVSEMQQMLLLKGTDMLREVSEGIKAMGAAQVMKHGAMVTETPDSLCFPQKRWAGINALAMLCPETFASLPVHIASNLQDWRNALASKDTRIQLAMGGHSRRSDASIDDPEEAEASRSLCEVFPAPWNSPDLNRFDQLLLLRMIQPLQLFQGVQRYVQDTTDERYVNFLPATMHDLYQSSEPRTPIMVLLSSGADPAASILKLAASILGNTDKLHAVSLGQGQGPKATRMIEDSLKQGHWVLLQNCHLAKSWLPDLERIVNRIMENQELVVHESFRLFLTSSPVVYFPTTILHSCVKITHQPPQGLRANLQRTMTDMDQDLWNHLPDSRVWRRLLASLGFFHAVIQERRKFGSLGFNNAYQFSDSDRDAAQTVLALLLRSSGAATNQGTSNEVPWNALKYVVGHVHYGGRVTDEWDSRCVLAILEQFLNIAILGGADADLTDEEEDYVFTDSGAYYIPCLDGEKGLEVLQNYCNGLPMHDQPEIFGMHSNADVVYRHQQGSQILNLALKVRGGGTLAGSSEKSSKEDSVEDADRRIGAQLLEDIPDPISKETVNQALLVRDPQTALISCMASFLLHEIDRFNKLLVQIRESLMHVQGALSGLLTMTQELDTVSASLRQNTVPQIWHTLAYPSRKALGNWVHDLQQRVSFIGSWSTMTCHPPCFWLSYFFFPQGFLTGVLQSFSRRHGMPIDSLVFKHKVRSEVCDASEIYSGPEEGVYTCGPFMEGGRWDIHSQQIEDCRPGEMFSSMPVIHFLPVGEVDYIEDLQAEGNLLRYACPVYKTTARAGELSTTGQSTNFVCSVLLPTTVSPNSWVLKGVALICALDE